MNQTSPIDPNAQYSRDARAAVAQLIREQGADLRRRFRDYDRWTGPELARYTRDDIQFMRNAITRNGAEWRTLIPREMVRIWGDEAPAAFVRRIQELTAERNLTNDLYPGMMRGIYSAALRDQFRVELPSAFAITLTNGHTATALPGEVVNYAITTEAELTGGTSVVVAMPRSVTAEVVRINPRAPLNPAIQDGIIAEEFGPAMVYEAGRASARGYANQIGVPTRRDFSHLSTEQLCQNIRNIEREVHNTAANDVDTREVLQTALQREFTSCPVITPPPTPLAPTARELQQRR